MSARDAYEKANVSYRLACREYNRAQLAFRERMITAEQFITAGVKFDAEQAAWDRAEAAYIAAIQRMNVAEMIRDHLGGGRFDAMTGAMLYVGGDNFLQFRLPQKIARDGINSVRITLNERETYDVEFFKIGRRGLDVRAVATVSNVYGDQLCAVFRERTGLDTSL